MKITVGGEFKRMRAFSGVVASCKIWVANLGMVFTRHSKM